MQVSVACLTENQGFSAAGGHRLYPPRFLAAFVFGEVFERTDMMDLDLVSHIRALHMPHILGPGVVFPVQIGCSNADGFSHRRLP
jgi:hypothetical protein